MHFDGSFFEMQFIGNLLVGESFSDTFNYIYPTLRQAFLRCIKGVFGKFFKRFQRRVVFFLLAFVMGRFKLGRIKQFMGNVYAAGQNQIDSADNQVV